MGNQFIKGTKRTRVRRIELLMIFKGIRSADLARKLGTTGQYVDAILKGKTGMSASRKMQLAFFMEWPYNPDMLFEFIELSDYGFDSAGNVVRL